MTVRVGGLFHLRLERTDLATPPLAAWLRDVVGPLRSQPTTRDEGRSVPGFVVRFEERVRPRGRPLHPLPAVPGDRALHLVDHAGRGAIVPLAELSSHPIVVDRAIDPWFFEPWVYLPLLRVALWSNQVVLVHSAGLVVGGRRIVVTGWEGSGKSRVMLELLGRGADLLGDDWVALSAAGTLMPVTGHVALNEAHRGHVPQGTWPGSRSALRRVGVSALRGASRRLSKWPTASKGLAHVAESWGPTTLVTDVGAVFPGASIGEPGPLDTLLLLMPPGTEAPERDRVPDAISAQTQIFLDNLPRMEFAFRYAFPGVLREPLSPPPEQERDVIASALSRVRVFARGFTGADNDVRAAAELLTSDRPDEDVSVNGRG